MCILCILIPIIVGLICALLGYFLGRQREKNSKVYTELRAELAKVQSENMALRRELEPKFDADLAAAAMGEKVVENDLKVVEGIGPAIEKLFQDAGIKTWKALAESPVEKCQQILDAEGENYKVHRPGTWPTQAEIAYHGLWKVLKKWQDEMIGGKE